MTENDHYSDLMKRSNYIFEQTKKNMKKYEKERQKLLKYTETKNVASQEWEDFINFLEDMIKD